MPASRFPTAQIPSISVALFFTARVRFIFPSSIFPETFTSRKSLLLVPSTTFPVIVTGIANAGSPGITLPKVSVLPDKATLFPLNAIPSLDNSNPESLYVPS